MPALKGDLLIHFKIALGLNINCQSIILARDKAKGPHKRVTLSTATSK